MLARVMKKTILITTSLLLVSCGHDTAPAPATTPATPTVHRMQQPVATAQPGRYIALPGQALVDANAAFDQQAAQYANPTVVAPTVANPLGLQAPTAPAQNPLIVSNPYAGTTPAVVNPAPNAYTGQGSMLDAAVGTGTAAGVVAGTIGGMQPANPAVSGPVNYTMRITNATPGRIFVEAHDAAGEIYPCGFMVNSDHIDSEKQQVAPIKGPITVVVRDPDKPGSPELRRYQVDPPKDYAGKTVEITIISGGRYQVSVDGQVRYITPTPVAPSQPTPVVVPPTNTVGTVTGMEAPKPATPAPAPAPQPAGM